VPLGQLKNIAFDIGEHNWRRSGGKLFPVAVPTQPIDLFPVRGFVYSGRERGDGFVTHDMQLVLATGGLKHVLDTYLSSGSIVSAAMTVYLRRHELDTYARYNCYLSLPKPKQDITYVRQGVFRVTWRLTNLEAL